MARQCVSECSSVVTAELLGTPPAFFEFCAEYCDEIPVRPFYARLEFERLYGPGNRAAQRGGEPIQRRLR